MRIANLRGRAVLISGDRALDVERASNGVFSSHQDIYDNWHEFSTWSKTQDPTTGEPFTAAELGPAVPRPRQIFAVGLNYLAHAQEASLPVPDELVVFTKFQSCLAGPEAEIELPAETVDYESELVVVISKEASQVSVNDAWEYVAGLAVGQDISERETQRRGPAAQFSLGKSFANFGPIGPAVVSLDEVPNKDSLPIKATLSGAGIDGEFVLQDGNTDDMIFSVPEQISRLSQIVTLYPGDLIFTGTPAGVGLARGILMKPGQVLTTTIEGLGTLRNVFYAKQG